MKPNDNAPKLVTERKLEAYFHNTLRRSADRLHVTAQDATLHYVTQLLSNYSRSEQVFDCTEDGMRITPLANLYGAALEAGSRRERQLWLQRLGDMALFIGGLFSGRLSRRFQDIDYCIAMGGNAYGYLEQTADDHARVRGLASIFGELSQHFGQFVDLVATVGDRDAAGDSDLLRLYEDWQATGDPALERRLRQFGLISAETRH